MVSPFPVFPSPNVHVNVMGSASGSEDPTALNVMLSPALTEPEGSIVMFAVGGLLLPRTSMQPASEVKIINMTIIRPADLPPLMDTAGGSYEINPTIRC